VLSLTLIWESFSLRHSLSMAATATTHTTTSFTCRRGKISFIYDLRISTYRKLHFKLRENKELFMVSQESISQHYLISNTPNQPPLF